jgi:hypothetical protein
MMPGDRLYDPAQDKQWSIEVYQKTKQVIEDILSPANDWITSSVIYEAMKQRHQKLCDDTIKGYNDYPVWKWKVGDALQDMKRKGKVICKDRKTWRWVVEKENSSPSASTPSPPPKRHEELKQKMIYVGKKLGYHVSAEEGALYRHDVLWKQGAYKGPCHVIEICEGGSLPKDFDALHWANDPKNWGAKGILIVTDNKDFEKAIKRFVGQAGLIVVKAETVDALCKIVDDNLEFLELIFSKES